MSFQTIFRSRLLYTNKAEIVSAFGVLMFIAGCWLDFYYQQHLPTLPDTALGRTYELDEHGRFFYMTHRESITLHVLIFGGWLVGVAGILPKVREFRKRWKQVR